jgi:hypothetical protein
MTFRSSAFNTSKVRPYFLNSHNFGDDLAQHLIYELRKMGCPAEEPGQEDFGWYVPFKVIGKLHVALIGFRPADRDWLLSIERPPLLFLRRRVDAAAPRAIHAALSDPAKFEHVRWHVDEDYDSGHEEYGVSTPFED